MQPIERSYSPFNFFPKLCFIFKNRFLARFVEIFQERLLVPSSNPEFVVWAFFWSVSMKTFHVQLFSQTLFDDTSVGDHIITSLFISKRNYRMAQTTQWSPAILDYMKNALSPYQRVWPSFLYSTASTL